MQVRKREEAADHTSADLARQVAALDQKDRSASEKEKSLSSLTAELWAKVTPLHCLLVLPSDEDLCPQQGPSACSQVDSSEKNLCVP